MDQSSVWQDALKGSNALALATAVDDAPNVRVVNYCFDPERPNVLYFASDRNNRKISEFQRNGRVALTTIPADGEAVPHLRSWQARVRKSACSITELAPLFVAAIPGYDHTIEAIGDTLDVYEIHMEEALLVLDFENERTIVF